MEFAYCVNGPPQWQRGIIIPLGTAFIMLISVLIILYLRTHGIRILRERSAPMAARYYHPAGYDLHYAHFIIFVLMAIIKDSALN
jgi:hypothetical protein